MHSLSLSRSLVRYTISLKIARKIHYPSQDRSKIYYISLSQDRSQDTLYLSRSLVRYTIPLKFAQRYTISLSRSLARYTISLKIGRVRYCISLKIARKMKYLFSRKIHYLSPDRS